MQGFVHFRLTQDLSSGHSEFIVHSGRHPGGIPKYCGLQEHTAWPLFTRHSLLGPQGLRLQGF